MSERTRLSAPARRVRVVAIVSLMLLTTGEVLLGTWSALAHPQEALPAVGSGTPETPVASPTPEATKPEGVTTTLPDAAQATAAAAVAAAAPRPAPTNVAPYTLVQTQTFTPADSGQPFRRATREFYQRSDGLFALVRTYYRPTGEAQSVAVGFGYAGLGAFRVDDERQEIEFLAPLGDEVMAATAEELRADPNFERDDRLLGQEAIVSRYPRKKDAPSYTEVYRAPALGNAEIKTIAVSPRGQETVEPTSLIVGEPSPDLFNRIARYRKSYARFGEFIRREETAGRDCARRAVAPVPGEGA